ncbi:MAG: IS5 family transposase [Acidimicrobiia bacterium]|nr:IS5 family transposase [Acidimicrobiia bacterium]
MTDEEWATIEEFFVTYSQPGTIGRPAKWDKRDIVNAVFYVLATGCQWRALAERYPHWNTVHRYHKSWSEDGTWEAVAAHVVGRVREREGREGQPSAGVIDARTVRGAATVCGSTRGYDAGKKISGRKVFGVVDTCGLLIAVAVVAAFGRFCRSVGIVASVVKRAKVKGFEPLPRRWVVERTWSWLMNHRRLQIDYERDPVTTEGFIWAAQTRLALRNLT